MTKQYGQNRRQEDRVSQSRIGAKPVERRFADHSHSAQLLWSFVVAVVLIFTAAWQLASPKNALMEQDRQPAQIRFESQ